MKRTTRFIVFLSVLCMSALIAMPALAGSQTVSNDLELEAAVASPDIDSITVLSGDYSVNLVISRDLTITASGDVTLRRPDFISRSSTVEPYDDDLPIITVINPTDAAINVTIDGFEFGNAEFDSEGLSASEWEGTTIGILAGSGIDLTVTDCTVTGYGIYAPLVVTTWDDLFEKALGVVDNVEIPYLRVKEVISGLPSSLTMSGCDFSYYGIAGVALIGNRVSAEISGNILAGHGMEYSAEDASSAGDFLSKLAVATVSNSLFSDLGTSYEEEIGLCGILVANGNDDEVRLTGNNIVRNYVGVAAIKEVSQLFNSELTLDESSATEAGEGLSIEENNDIRGNIVGVAALGGLDILLEWNVSEDVSEDYGTLLISPDIVLADTDPMPLFIQDTVFSDNTVGTVLAGKVKATVDSNDYSYNVYAGIVGIGDLSESYITDNTFGDTFGAPMVFAFQKADIDSALEMFGIGESPYGSLLGEDSLNIEQTGTLTVSGNTISSRLVPMDAQSCIDDHFGGSLTPESIMSQALAIGTRMANGGPFSLFSPSSRESSFSYAGIVMLDGARNIKVEDNTIGDTMLGIVAVDTGLVEDIRNIDITDNTVEGNLCGLALLGAGKIAVPLAYSLLLTPDAFMSADNMLELGDVAGNSFSGNYVGMVSAFSVDGEIRGNYFDDNAILGMAHIGIGTDWVKYIIERYAEDFFNEYSADIASVSGDIYPTLTIKKNNITGNGTDPGNVLDWLVESQDYLPEDVTPADLLCGGVLVIDASKGIKLNENNITGNGSFGVLATARAIVSSEDLNPAADEGVSIDVTGILDASDNWWGAKSGPSSYVLSSDLSAEAKPIYFVDPVSGATANGTGDSVGSFMVKYDGIYYPFTIEEELGIGAAETEIEFLKEENLVHFGDWSEESFTVDSSTSSGSSGCGIGPFNPSMLLLIAPLVWILRRR